MRSRRMICVALVLGLAGFFYLTMIPGPAQADNYRLTIGAEHPTTAVWVENLQDFFCVEVKKRVAERTKHTIEWNYAWAGAVAKMGEVLESTQAGLLDITFIVIALEPTKLGLHNFGYYTPFASTDISLVAKITLEVFDKVPYLGKMFENYNQKMLGYNTASDSYHVVTKFPWTKVEELKGKKIAAVGANLLYVKSAGAVPVQSNLVEAYTSLQTGVYEGWVMFPSGTVGFKLYEVAPYYTFTDFGSVYGGIVTMNLDKWKAMPKEVQDILLEVGREGVFELAKAQEAKSKESIEIMRKAGVKFHQLSFEQKRIWANMTPNIPLEMAKKFDALGQPGTEVFDTYLQALENAGFKFPRRWQVK